MERYNQNSSRSNRMWSGLILLVIGIAFLLRNLDIPIPQWIFSWHTLLIVIGLGVGFKRNFNGGGWLILVIIGGYFTIQDIADVDFSQYYFAAAFIALGLWLILKPGRQNKDKWKNKFNNFNPPDLNTGGLPNTEENFANENSNYIDSVNVFGGSKQQIYSKNFKGGDVISIFGGCDLNLTQADFEGTITIDVLAIFGGVKIAVPPTWSVKSEITPIFGGVEDKRSVLPAEDQSQKIIKIKGVALFGGLSITNY